VSPARLTVLSGPSGVGKGSVVAAVRRRHPGVWLSVSVTTRAPRPGETDGVEYRFVDDAEFSRLVEAGELLEHDAHMGASYGTPRQPVEEQLARGVPVLLEIDLNGARQVRAQRLMERLEISPSRRVRGLGAKQREALHREFGGA
jgi:guanylate kinase